MYNLTIFNLYSSVTLFIEISYLNTCFSSLVLLVFESSIVSLFGIFLFNLLHLIESKFCLK